MTEKISKVAIVTGASRHWRGGGGNGLPRTVLPSSSTIPVTWNPPKPLSRRSRTAAAGRLPPGPRQWRDGV